MTKKSSDAGGFTEAEYRDDVRRVIEHAVENGTAVVTKNDGTPRVVITIPTVDLPSLWPDD